MFKDVGELPKLGKINLGGEEDYSLDLDYYLSREYGDIGHACAELPAIIEWVNSKLQEVSEAKIVKKHEIKEVEAQGYFRIKSGKGDIGLEVKMTEAAIVHAIALDEKVVVAYREFAVLSGWVQRLTNLLFSLQAKLDLVRSTEATRRKGLDEGNDSED